MHDLSDVKHIKRIIVGSDNPAYIKTQAEVDEAMEELNQHLTGSPRGTLVAVERSFSLVRIGEHQVVLQWIAYHVGFPRKPPPPQRPFQPAPVSAPIPGDTEPLFDEPHPPEESP